MNSVSKEFFICVFCGSSEGAQPVYRQAAEELGRLLGERGFGLVYGGASIGLMGAVADAALATGASVIGAVPEVLRDAEVAHAGLTELHYVDSMHQRKALMAERADAFIVLPGGFGTLDELFEILTWRQLGIHAKPVLLVNTLGYFDGLLRFVDHAVEQGFVRPAHRATLQVAPSAEFAIALLQTKLEHRSAGEQPRSTPRA